MVKFLVAALLACQLANPASLPASQDRQAESLTATLEEGGTIQTPTVSFAQTQESELQTNPALPIPAVASLPQLIESAKEDLAQTLQIPISRINVREAREVFWADTSLGCPQPGTAYSQIQTPGYFILLEFNGKEYEYHANIHNHVFYCENPTLPILETPGSIPLPP